jgi:hypothetical protein
MIRNHKARIEHNAKMLRKFHGGTTDRVTPVKPMHGGKREGAGRPAGEPYESRRTIIIPFGWLERNESNRHMTVADIQKKIEEAK